MLKKIALIGLVILLLGVVLFAAGTYEAKAELHTLSTYAPYGSGEFISPEINLTQSAAVTISHPPANLGLVTAANLSSVTSANFATETIAPAATSGGNLVYTVSAGSYYVVYFGSTAPTTQVSYLYLASAEIWGLAVLAGLAMLIAGGITALVGAIKKPKTPPGSAGTVSFAPPPAR
jgi:hypothetical protein